MTPSDNEKKLIFTYFHLLLPTLNMPRVRGTKRCRDHESRNENDTDCIAGRVVKRRRCIDNNINSNYSNLPLVISVHLNLNLTLLSLI